MRILTIAKDLERGGTQRVAQTFSLEYARQGHDAALLAYDHGGVRQSLLEEGGVPVYVGGDTAATASALASCEAFCPDVIHFHREGRTNPREGDLIRRLKTRGRIVVETSHFGRIDYSPDADLIDVHTQLSRWCLWRWKQWLGPRRRTTLGVIVPNPVDVDRFQPASEAEVSAFRADLGLPAGAFLCGRIGQAGRGKWSPALLKSFERLARDVPDAYLLIIGIPPKAKRDLARLPRAIRDRVIEHPLVDDDRRLALLYSSFDVFLHAAKIGETFGLVLAESMLCGTPPVTMNTPHKDNSQSDVVQHGKGGYVALSAGYLPQALHAAYQNPAERAQMAAASRQSIIDRFGAARVTGLLLKTIQHTVDARDRADLTRRIEEDAELVSDIDRQEVHRMLHDGIGRPSIKDLALMRIVSNPWVYRLYSKLKH